MAVRGVAKGLAGQKYHVTTLEKHRDNKSAAASKLGLSRGTVLGIVNKGVAK